MVPAGQRFHTGDRARRHLALDLVVHLDLTLVECLPQVGRELQPIGVEGVQRRMEDLHQLMPLLRRVQGDLRSTQ